MNNFTLGCKVQSIKNHIVEFPDPISTYYGEKLEFIKKDNKGWFLCRKSNGKEGWVPKNYLDVTSGDYFMNQDYNAREMDIKLKEEGEVKIIESEWCWVELFSGKSGWVPFESLKIIN